MRPILKKSVLAAVMVATLSVTGPIPSAEAGNSWRWAKPLNQKPGSLFYSTNRRSKSTQRPTSTRYLRYGSVRTVAPTRHVVVGPTVTRQRIVMSSKPTQSPIVTPSKVVEPVNQKSTKLKDASASAKSETPRAAGAALTPVESEAARILDNANF
ncbi:MAG: hypothetical protein AAGG48_20930 [Planctomycetota bacterium]